MTTLIDQLKTTPVASVQPRSAVDTTVPALLIERVSKSFVVGRQAEAGGGDHGRRRCASSAATSTGSSAPTAPASRRSSASSAGC